MTGTAIHGRDVLADEPAVLVQGEGRCRQIVRVTADKDALTVAALGQQTCLRFRPAVHPSIRHDLSVSVDRARGIDEPDETELPSGRNTLHTLGSLASKTWA